MDNEQLELDISEAAELILECIKINNIEYKVALAALCKAFVTGLCSLEMNHSGYLSLMQEITERYEYLFKEI